MSLSARARIVSGSLFAVMALSACGAALTPPPVPANAVAAVPPTIAAPQVSAIPPTPSPMPAPLPTPTPASSSFPIVPRFPGGAAGTVIATPVASGVRYHVVVSGLVASSAHTIHDHMGTCALSGASRHLSVLATTAADSHGDIVFDVTVPAFEFGAGRIVIVYDSARPVLITGCASL